MVEVVDPDLERLCRAAQPTVDALDRRIRESPSSLRPLLAEIRDHYYEPGYTVQDLRESLAASRWIYEQFRRHVGLTPWKLIQECRMELASRLLRDTSSNVKDVSYLVGYEDFMPFVRLSVRWCRLSPAHLRDRLRALRRRLRMLPEDVLSWGYWRRAVSGELSREEARRLILFLDSQPKD